MHADDGLSKPPCSQKCRQHGLTYLPRLDNGHPRSSNFAGPKDWCTTPHTHRFQRAQDLAFNKPKLQKI
jgi:hypothetical protein